MCTEGEDDISLCRDVTDDFDACTDASGTIDVFAVTLGGALCHIRHFNGNTYVNMVLENRNPGRVRNVRVLRINSHFHVFYCLECTERLLVHQVAAWTDYSVKPDVLCKIGRRYVYDVVSDASGNIYIVYTSDEGKVSRIKYSYSSKQHDKPEILYEYEARFISMACHNDIPYMAFTSVKDGRNNVAVCNILSGETHIAGVHVHLNTQTAIYPDGEGLAVEWTENSMCFSCTCNLQAVPSKVSIKGKSNRMLRVNISGKANGVFMAASNRSGMPFFDLTGHKYESEGPAGFENKGHEVDELSRKYIEVLSRENQFSDMLKEDLTRIEASLERLVLLAEKALTKDECEVKEESDVPEIVEEEI